MSNNKQSQQREENVNIESIFESCGTRMSNNKQSQQREENANIDLKEKNAQAN